jgi:hypothetical protein
MTSIEDSISLHSLENDLKKPQKSSKSVMNCFKWNRSNINYTLNFDLHKDKFKNITCIDCKTDDLKLYKFDAKFISTSTVFKAQHKITIGNDPSEFFCANVIQISNKNFHSIEILNDHKNPLAVGIRIGSESLPEKMFTNSPITLGKNEAAFFIENSKSDYFILIGNWTTQNTVRIKIFDNFGECVKVEIFDKEPFEFILKDLHLTVDFYSHMIRVQTSLVRMINTVDLASIIAVIFSTNILKFLLMPRQSVPTLPS